MKKELSCFTLLLALLTSFLLPCCDSNNDGLESWEEETDVGTDDDSGWGTDHGTDTHSDTAIQPDTASAPDSETDTEPEIGAECYEGPENYPAVPGGLTLNTVQASNVYTETAQITTDGIFAVHWAGITQDEANWLLARLAEIRCVSLAYGMKDPPTAENSWYYNVFVHTGADGLGNGQGTDFSHTKMPYLTLPTGASQDPSNVDHEGFHIFQYQANSPGFAYAGDSQWFIEAAAQWFATTRNPVEAGSFVEAGAIVYNPHLTLWHSFSNEAPGDPDSSVWTYGVRQYGLHTWLFYLTELAGVERAAIPTGFYAKTSKLPQEYYYGIVGGETMRTYFADWTAHSRADFDYLTREQVARAQNEISYFIGQGNKVDPYVAELSSSGTNGAWQTPADSLKPRGWSFNTVRIENPATATYELAIQGDAKGSEGATSHLEGRVVVVYGEANGEFTALNMSNDVNGSASVTVKAGATELYLVVVAVPEHFSGNQNYGYQYRITGP